MKQKETIIYNPWYEPSENDGVVRTVGGKPVPLEPERRGFGQNGRDLGRPMTISDVSPNSVNLDQSKKGAVSVKKESPREARQREQREQVEFNNFVDRFQYPRYQLSHLVGMGDGRGNFITDSDPRWPALLKAHNLGPRAETSGQAQTYDAWAKKQRKVHPVSEDPYAALPKKKEKKSILGWLSKKISGAIEEYMRVDADDESSDLIQPKLSNAEERKQVEMEKTKRIKEKRPSCYKTGEWKEVTDFVRHQCPGGLDMSWEVNRIEAEKFKDPEVLKQYNYYSGLTIRELQQDLIRVEREERQKIYTDKEEIKALNERIRKSQLFARMFNDAQLILDAMGLWDSYKEFRLLRLQNCAEKHIYWARGAHSQFAIHNPELKGGGC